MTSKLIGTYVVLVGGLYFVNGAAVMLLRGAVLPAVIGVGAVLTIVGMLMLVAGGGIVMERGWARYLGIALLGFDVVEKAFGVYLGSVLEVFWLCLSLGAFGILVFANPYDQGPKTDLDEDQNVHALGSLRC